MVIVMGSKKPAPIRPKKNPQAFIKAVLNAYWRDLLRREQEALERNPNYHRRSGPDAKTTE